MLGKWAVSSPKKKCGEQTTSAISVHGDDGVDVGEESVQQWRMSRVNLM
jgi:hypothetical protein